MSKLSSSSRIVYLSAIFIVFAIMLSITLFNRFRSESIELTGTEPDLAAIVSSNAESKTPAADANAFSESASESDGPTLADSAPAEEAGGLQYDHHGNPIREDPAYEEVIEKGASVEFTVENFLGAGGRGGEFAAEIFEGEYAVLKFNISDANTGNPLSGLNPAAWMDLTAAAAANQESLNCQDQVKSYLSGTVSTRPLVNFNSYFILAMNDEATISVIDPMIDVAGMTNLFTMMDLPETGADWAMNDDQTRLFVTMPEAGQVAVGDLEKFRIFDNIETGGRPIRLVFSPDGRYLWVGNDSDLPDQSGVTVIDPETLEVVARIPTASGHHELAFSADGRYALITNSTAGSLSIVDTETLSVVNDVQIGQEPVAVDVSAANQDIYVANAGDGTIAILDGDRIEPVARLETKPGLTSLRFSPDGQWGFITNSSQSEVYLFDVAANSIRYVLPVQGAPDQISFGRDAAYIRSRGLPSITSIPLADLGESDTLTVVNLPVGQNPPGIFPTPAAANSIFATPDEGAMLMAHPADDQIYFYVEGTPAPSGGFQGHGLNPRAVLVVDRSLREEAPGVYTGRVRVPASGELQVAFLLDNPSIVHCFTFAAKPNPDVVQSQAAAPPKMKLLTDLDQLKAGEPFAFQLLLSDPNSDEPLTDIPDLTVLMMRAGGTWNQRYLAEPQGQGLYEVELIPPGPGPYQVLLAVPSLQYQYKELPVYQFMVAVEETSS